MNKELIRKSLAFCENNSALLILLVLVILNCFIRLIPLSMPVTDEWAASTIEQNFKQYTTNNIRIDNPNLPDSKVSEQVDVAWLEFQKSSEYVTVRNQLSENFKEAMKTDEGIPYLHEIDPYFWYQHALNVLDHGYPGDIKKDGRDYTVLRLAPTGNYLGPDEFNSYFMAWWGWLAGFFGVSVFGAAFFIPVFLTSLTVIFAFLIGRRLGGNLVGFIAGLLIITNVQFLSRTTAGFADTDSYTVLLPLLIIWCVINSFYSETKKGLVLWNCVAGFFVGIFGWAWIGWSFAYDLILGALGLFLVYLWFSNREAVKFHLLRLVSFFGSACVFIYLFRDIRSVYAGPFSFLWFMNLQDVASTKIWPNVLTTVAEQNATSLSSIVSIVGGWSLVIIALLGLYFLFKEKKRFFLFLAIPWLLATAYAATKGTRYVQLMIPVFALLVGFGIKLFYDLLEQHGEDWLKINSKYLKITLVVVVLLFATFVPIKNAEYQAKYALPEFNDAWYNALHFIATNTSSDSIISSWWDWGHWFKAIGERGVTFDGTSQDSPQAHWIGKTLITNDEQQAVNILKMLNCNGNTAYDDLINAGYSSLSAVNQVYSEYINTEKSNITKYCDISRSSVFITSQDMVYKAPVWAHFGLWNFTRAQIAQDVKNKGYSELDTSGEGASVNGMDNSALNSWISPWPQYLSSPTSCDMINNTLYCSYQGNGFIFDFNNNTFSGGFFPKVIAYGNSTSFNTTWNENATANLGVIFSSDGFYVLCDPILADSIFTRLFYFDGVGLEHFVKSYDTVSFKGERIQVWKVKYE